MEAGKKVIRKKPAKVETTATQGSGTAKNLFKTHKDVRKGATSAPDLSWQAKGILAGSEVVEIAITDIDTADTTFQCRVTLKNLKPLMKSILTEGQLEPVRLRGKKPPYQIVCGFSRIEAIERIQGKIVKAIILDNLTDDEGFRLSYTENAKRQSLTPMDKAHVVGRLEKASKAQADIAIEMGLSEKQVGNLKRALDFPKELQTTIASGDLSLKHGLLLHSAARQRKVDFAEWIKRVKSDNLSVEGLKKALRKEAPKRGRKKEYLKIKGHKIISPRFVLDLDKASEIEKAALKNAMEIILGKISI